MENTETKRADEPTIAQTTKKMPKAAKVILIIVGALVALVIVALIAVNIFVRTTYATFYDQAQDEFMLPGLDSGFIPQDIDFYDVGETWIVSGYMNDGSPSPLYKIYVNGEVTRVFAQDEGGNAYDGHGSAVTSTDDFVYLTCENGYLVYDANDFIALTEGEEAVALAKVDLDFSPAFMNIEGDDLLLGNFYQPEAYETPEEHDIGTSDGGQNHAVMYAYPASSEAEYGFATIAERVYSIPDRVQGICATDSEKLVFSTSYGLASSHIMVFDVNGMEADGVFATSSGEVPLYILDSRTMIEDLEAPPMTEGIETHQGRIFVSNESACNKYIFGKLYGAVNVVSIPIPE